MREWSDGPLRVAVLVGSTREGRAGGAVAGWFTERAGERRELAPEVVDLRDAGLPARLPRTATGPMSAFSARVAAAEGFVVVTPEYNRGFPAALKQAIDCAYDEWRAKPVGFVSYGSGGTGGRAVDQLRVVFSELHTVTLRDEVGHDLLESPLPGPLGERRAGALLDQLTWWGLALRDARALRHYPS
ncbi:NADPH-dependent oxidoreductase [Streptomyces sp. AJS327]|uniref:NADPH-dependent FMN reductase n=1 Tax=Streptomyces sp. AJS327 TaxID=2545265 RepID=UPI0015DDB2C5|nr:NAD(P)H-dependent oxidoreductase [Streptomyces sp. AJS327]MBA0052252.1 NADPH-dependent oxidoreductase [Streptomyces sp. AJS327]